jgi:hypothetical protein
MKKKLILTLVLSIFLQAVDSIPDASMLNPDAKKRNLF